MLCADRDQAACKNRREKPAKDKCLTLVSSLPDGVSFSSVHFCKISSAFPTIVSPCFTSQPVSHLISYVGRYWCQQPSDAAPRCSAQSALTKENVRLLLSVSFSGLLNKWLLVWLFLDLVLTWVDFLLYCHYLRNNLQMQQINAWEPDWAVPQTGSSKDTLWKDVHPLAPNCDFLILKLS